MGQELPVFCRSYILEEKKLGHSFIFEKSAGERTNLTKVEMKTRLYSLYSHLSVSLINVPFFQTKVSIEFKLYDFISQYILSSKDHYNETFSFLTRNPAFFDRCFKAPITLADHNWFLRK